jgi:hypothetical protein
MEVESRSGVVESTSGPTTTLLADAPTVAARGGTASTPGGADGRQTKLKADAAASARGAHRGLDLLALLRRLLVQLVSTFETRLDLELLQV